MLHLLLIIFFIRRRLMKKTLRNLFQNYNIMTKDFPDLDMTIYYNKYDNKHKTQMEMASRSVILSNSTRKVICYSCPTPIYNMDAVQYLWRNQDKHYETFICYEGSLISLFNHNNKWFVASRRNVYQDDNTGGQYSMFMEVLNQDNYKTIDEFTAKLDKKYSYHFVLIHHKNDNIVNYKNQFGEEYKKLCFIFARDNETQADVNPELTNATFITDNIFYPKKIDEKDTQKFISNLSTVNIINQPEHEGIIIKLNNNILKLQSAAYQFHKAIGSEKNMFRGFLSLYQNNSLKNFFTNETMKFKKIVNPLNPTESFDTIGIIDALFKVITSELYYLFYTLWNDNGEHLNKELYNKMPKEYKDILFHLRGIYFANKPKQHDINMQNINMQSINNTQSVNNMQSIIKMKDVYNFIKSIDTHVFEKFIRCRKLMLNWVRLDKTENAEHFNKTLHRSEKVFYKLSAIYTTKLFPEIMPDDLPNFEGVAK
jgi:hypothetical protein